MRDSLTKRQKQIIEEGVKKTVEEYGEVLIKLGNENEKFRKIEGANMDIDFSETSWKHGKCPWGSEHKCAVKDISICDFFEGIEPDDNVLCSYPERK